jgi:dolichyl-phosphate beta-glucosyltransferase
VQAAGETRVEASPQRIFVGRVFAFVVNLLAVGGVADSQCGFKMFRSGVVRAVFSRQRLDGFAFDVEVLFIARQLGLSIVEVPINWKNQPGSKVNVLTDSARMLWDVAFIRWSHRQGAMAGRTSAGRIEEART